MDDLLVPSPEAITGYAEPSGTPLTNRDAEVDENGFEVVDVEPAP